MSTFPLLFLLIIEGLRRLIHEAKVKGIVKGIKSCNDLSITHLFFSYDVMMCGMDSLNERRCYKEIINIFCKASGMYVSNKKSSFLHSKLDKVSLDGHCYPPI